VRLVGRANGRARLFAKTHLAPERPPGRALCATVCLLLLARPRAVGWRGRYRCRAAAARAWRLFSSAPPRSV